MEKRILTVYTGGTICTAPTDEGRTLSLSLAKRALLKSFYESDSPYSKDCESLFEDSHIPSEYQTLSENMTLERLQRIIEHIRGFDLNAYKGVIVLHGTDTLAFSSAMLSFAFCDTSVPIMLVSGNRPPMDEQSNATANFAAAVELIMKGIAPNVYVPYRNSDGVTYLHLGSSIMQCANYSEDFFSPEGKYFALGDESLFKNCEYFCAGRRSTYFPKEFCSKALLLYPYTGLDYSRISLDGVVGIVHGSYHSGTVCVEKDEEQGYSTSSILYLMDKCEEAQIPFFIAPSRLDSQQYASIYDLCRSSSALPLDMTVEAAYMKLVIGASLGLYGDALESFMFYEINNEFNY